MDTKQLATAAAHWLEYMDLSGYNNLFSESLLILQIAEYFRCKLWTVSAEKDCDELLGATSTRGIVNYDVYAQKNESEKIILEMKFVKATNPYYSRIVTDFVKLAIPMRTEQIDDVQRLVAFDAPCQCRRHGNRPLELARGLPRLNQAMRPSPRPAPRARKQVAPPHRDRTPRRVPASPR